MSQKEYRFLGLNMETISIIYSIFLIAWGLLVSFFTRSSSFTSLIPSFLGMSILVFSILSILIISKKKLFMHIVVSIGLLIFLGGLDIFRSIISGNLLNLFWADLSKIMMIISSILFIYLCIQSFIFARKNR